VSISGEPERAAAEPIRLAMSPNVQKAYQFARSATYRRQPLLGPFDVAGWYAPQASDATWLRGDRLTPAASV
jgi:hypothetical protein